MGDLVAMTRSIERSRIEARTDWSAEILFFTGVRYYRMTDEAAAKAVAPKRRRAVKPKKNLELPLEQHG